jgi:hypothetical protein
MVLEPKVEEKESKPVEIEIDETVEETPEIDLSGLSSKEKEMAEKHGIKETEKNGEHKVNTPDAKEGVAKEEVKEEVIPTFEETENDEKHLEKFNPNEKALYWKWKNDKRKRQDSQKKVDELQARLELETVKDKASAIKLGKIKNILASDTELTVDKLLAIIDEGGIQQEDNSDAPLKRSDLDKIEQEKRVKLEEQTKQTNEQKERLAIAENIGKTKYKNFDDLVNLAKEVVVEDKTGTYQEILNAALSDPNFDEEKLIDRVVTIAKLSSKYGKESASVEKKESVEKVIDNSKKKVSSASIGSSGGRRTIVEDDLTVEDAARLSADQWTRLSQQTRKRILGG